MSRCTTGFTVLHSERLHGDVARGLLRGEGDHGRALPAQRAGDEGDLHRGDAAGDQQGHPPAGEVRALGGRRRGRRGRKELAQAETIRSSRRRVGGVASRKTGVLDRVGTVRAAARLVLRRQPEIARQPTSA